MPFSKPCVSCKDDDGSPLDYNLADEKDGKLFHVFKDGHKVECPHPEQEASA